jgi:hypothetical protein
MLWLEPLVEVETDEGRMGYANVTGAGLAAVHSGDATHPLSLNRTRGVTVNVADPRARPRPTHPYDWQDADRRRWRHSRRFRSSPESS